MTTTTTTTMMKTKRRKRPKRESRHRSFFFCLPLVLFFYFVGAKTTTKTTRFFGVEGKEAKVKPSEEDFGAILISEIMYNPIKTKSSKSSSPEVTTDDTEKKASGEWVEFLNPSGTDEVDVSGWFFSDEKNLAGSSASMFQFPSNTTIKPKERIVVAKNLTKFEIAYGENEGASNVVEDAELPFKLNNKGEKLLLLNAKKEIVHEVEYNDKAPWPIVFAGYSIELTSQKSDANDPFSWVSSLTFGGTPGRENSVELVNKLVNN